MGEGEGVGPARARTGEVCSLEMVIPAHFPTLSGPNRWKPLRSKGFSAPGFGSARPLRTRNSILGGCLECLVRSLKKGAPALDSPHRPPRIRVHILVHIRLHMRIFRNER